MRAARFATQNNVLGFYDLVINNKKSEESMGMFMHPGYIHNPLIVDGADALGTC